MHIDERRYRARADRKSDPLKRTFVYSLKMKMLMLGAFIELLTTRQPAKMRLAQR